MDKKVFIQKYYCHSVQKVWDCITRAEHIEKWFLPKAEFELKVGEEYLFSAEPMGEWDGKLFGEILEIDEGVIADMCNTCNVQPYHFQWRHFLTPIMGGNSMCHIEH